MICKSIHLFLILFFTITVSAQPKFSFSVGPNYLLSKNYNGTSHTTGRITGKIGYEVNLNTHFEGKLDKFNFSLGFNQINFHNSVFSGSLGSSKSYDADFQLGRAQLNCLYLFSKPTYGFAVGLFYNYKIFESSKGTKTFSSISSATQIIELNGKTNEYLNSDFGLRAGFNFVYLFPGDGNLLFTISLNYQLNFIPTLTLYDYNNRFANYFSLTVGHRI